MKYSVFGNVVKKRTAKRTLQTTPVAVGRRQAFAPQAASPRPLSLPAAPGLASQNAEPAEQPVHPRGFPAGYIDEGLVTSAAGVRAAFAPVDLRQLGVKLLLQPLVSRLCNHKQPLRNTPGSHIVVGIACVCVP